MNEQHTCGNCRSTHLLSVAATPSGHPGIVVGEPLMHTVTVTKYVCTDCEAVTQWANDKHDLRRLRKLFDGQ